MIPPRKPKKRKYSIVKVLFWVIVIAFAILSYTGMDKPLKVYLESDSMNIKIGAREVTSYLILKAFIIIIVFLWVSKKISNIVEFKLRKSEYVGSGDRALTVKILNILLYVISPLIILYILGIDVTTLTVLGGAIGIGIGFGLQKIASNYISGIILLFEKSINEGDLVELVNGGFGFVKKISARYTLVETLKLQEVMIPNEDFITTRVTNWTLSDKMGRLDIDVRVSFDSDYKRAKEIMYEILNNHPMKSSLKAPECHLLKIGEYAYEYKMFLYVDDIPEYFFTATDSIINEVLNRFEKEGIKIPFPIQNINLAK